MASDACTDSPTISEVLARATARLRAAGCETARLDAEVLLAFVLGCDRAELVLRAQDDAPHNGVFCALVDRRAGREPVAYITGSREFRHITLRVDRRVLIPRPETELLVEAGLSLPEGVAVADVGTGSGAVALALKHERPDLAVVGIDLSDDALNVARANAALLGLDVHFVYADLIDDPRRYDAVLANLPYVSLDDASVLAPEIAEYEPGSAVFAADGGLELISRLIARVPGVSLLALEVGLGQAAAVAQMMAEAGFGPVQRLHDLAGLERVVVGRR